MNVGIIRRIIRRMTDSSFIDHELIAQIDGFLAANPKMSETALGRKVAKDGSLISAIRRGRDIRGSTREKIIAFINSHPAGAAE